nr:efflux transporter outer membrane subunit [uncultured Holophaga sp.]
MKLNRCLLGLVPLLLMTGCLKVHRESPRVVLPGAWKGPVPEGPGLAAGGAWWRAFGDPELDRLVELALKTNNDLAAAALKVRKAQLEAGLTDTNLTPDVSASLTGEGDRDLKAHQTTRAYTGSLSLSYEVDLWGRLASARDASHWEAEATEADRRNTALVLVGTAAKAYWQVAYLNQRITTAEASLAYARKTRDLVQVKYGAGAVSRLDLVQAGQTVASQQSTLEDLKRQLAAARNALAILFDRAPGETLTDPASLPTAPLPKVEAGLPATLLARRPDLEAAELRLRESWAEVDATRASFYPTLTLTGALGSSSETLRQVLKNPVATLGAGLTLPFLQWNTARRKVRISKTAYEIAVTDYRQTLYAALADVEDALVAVEAYRVQALSLEESLDLAREAERLSEIRYRAGAVAIQVWLDAQETRRSAENSLAENRLNRLQALMTLFQALGGGQDKTSLRG